MSDWLGVGLSVVAREGQHRWYAVDFDGGTHFDHPLCGEESIHVNVSTVSTLPVGYRDRPDGGDR